MRFPELGATCRVQGSVRILHVCAQGTCTPVQMWGEHRSLLDGAEDPAPQNQQAGGINV